MNATRRRALLSASVALAALCAARCDQGPTSSVRITFPEDLSLEPTSFSFAPPERVMAARFDRNHVLSLETDGRSFDVLAPEACPTHVPAAAPGPPVQLVAAALLDFGPRYLSQVGYDADLEIRARAGCREGEGARVEWAQLEGPLLDRQLSDGGRALRLHTLPLRHFFPNGLPGGVVAVSPRTQGRYVFEASARLPHGPLIRRRVTITSIARATGLSSIAVSQRVLLGHPDLALRSAPRGSRARVEPMAGGGTFTADVAGRYALADAAGHRVDLQALAHEHTPLDCGRTECHASEALAARDSAMSHALERVALPVAPRAVARCALDCHAAGEPGLHDGGFVDVSGALRFAALDQTPISDLPTALRRLAGVRCTSCHGPGAIPPADGRARILRADVCATCHDAPPTYDHVSAWRESRMATADRDTRTRAAPTCARCHTTGGFLDAIGVRRREDLSRDPDGRSVGVACAACHAPHAAHRERALVRSTPAAGSLAPDALLNAAPSALCTQCHAPLEGETRPSASSAPLWLGRVRVPDALGGGLLEGPAPHAALKDGCMACHGVTGVGKSVKHSFGVAVERCKECHLHTPDDGASVVREQARTLLSELDARCAIPSPRAPGPNHAGPQGDERCRGHLSLARARYGVSLVVEDPAAGVHNLPFSESLVESARRALGSVRRASNP